MASLRSWLRRARGVFDRRRHDIEFDDGLNAHLDAHIADNVRAGMTRAESRRDALLKMGGAAQTAEAYRDRRGLPFVETTTQDLRYALFGLSAADPSVYLLAGGIAGTMTIASSVIPAVRAATIDPAVTIRNE